MKKQDELQEVNALSKPSKTKIKRHKHKQTISPESPILYGVLYGAPLQPKSVVQEIMDNYFTQKEKK